MSSVVQHGCCHRESQFEIVRHEYAAAEASVYIECLEVVDGPEEKPKYIVHWHYVQNTDFPGEHSWYFESLEDAVRAWKGFFLWRHVEPVEQRFAGCRGFIAYEYNKLSDSTWYYSSPEL